ncbi:MAG: alpha-ketoglutarate-dependent dioxygenase AlkB family protein [Halothece sp.]
MSQQLDIFDQLESHQPQVKHPSTEKKLIDVDGEAIFYPHFFRSEEANQLFQELENNISWRQDYIKFYGKVIPLPRLTAWYGDEGKSYTYSGIEYQPNPWILTLETIKAKVETVANVRFNSVLLNFYRTGKDSMAWHSDDEPELGINPVIASVSFGGSRRFCLKHKKKLNSKVNVELFPGSLLVMKGELQHYWLHQVPKTKKAVNPRINLTFRVIQ